MTRENDEAILGRAAVDDKAHPFEWTLGGTQWTPGATHLPLARAHPLALVVRALSIIDCLQSEPVNRMEAPSNWIVMGITDALNALVKARSYDAAGLLLQALEELCAAENRRRWPLAGWQTEDVPAVFKD